MSFHLKGYKIIAKIGKGTFSDVYRVKDRQIGIHYAAKRLNEKCESLNDSRFYAEVDLMKTVPSHPNILSILGLVHDNDCLTFIMDLMDMNLFDLIHTRKRGLSESHARKILIQIIRGLEHLHRNGLFHRDIKPENILIKFVDGPHRKEIVQLGDFGLVARITDPLPLQPYISTRWYRAPECMLTMGYYGPKIDVWAVGCCFYEMVTREALFPGEDERHMLDLIHEVLGTPSQSLLAKFRMKRESFHFERRQPKDFRSLVPLLSVGGVDVLKKTIVYLPEQRISTRKLLEHIYFEDFVYV
ncbi:MAPK/MAK/MRK overlapping kinase-like [Anopheles ziemanni]|uniref:MAPK/MAK/MRK overlapping kinase-like n=1 Tax=Anopheles coustani TaxID=139045 RepID=UPI00265AF46D|nr:MAPK/MAK/MRK overlapping kinase-like [Anopheles coustani]XP_058174384.1 MAPK/MAK/MRK overlapping kinase-like [Anopheles ziemanni]